MTDTITITIREVDGELMLNSRGLALLCGVDAEAVNALHAQSGFSYIPDEWMRRGRQRASEAKAHTGSNTLLDSLRYWAAKDHNASVEFIYKEH